MPKIGAEASIAPIYALILGHMFAGADTVSGIHALVSVVEGAVLNDFLFARTVGCRFACWSVRSLVPVERAY
jgi:hypothetical protein